MFFSETPDYAALRDILSSMDITEPPSVPLPIEQIISREILEQSVRALAYVISELRLAAWERIVAAHRRAVERFLRRCMDEMVKRCALEVRQEGVEKVLDAAWEARKKKREEEERLRALVEREKKCKELEERNKALEK